MEQERQRADVREVYLHKELDMFIARLHENNTSIDDKLRRITSEYLVLRHNARVAVEQLLANSIALKAKHKEVDSSIRKVITVSEEKKTSVLEVLRLDYEMKVDHRRSEIMQLENDAESAWNIVEMKKTKLINNAIILRNQLHDVKLKYNLLQNKRRDELITVTSELKKWRQNVELAEDKCSSLGNEVTADKHSLWLAEERELKKTELKLASLRTMLDDMSDDA